MERSGGMIRLINQDGDPIWIRPKCINTIQNHTLDIEGSVIAYHVGSSCFHLHMDEDADEVMRIINLKIHPPQSLEFDPDD